MKVFPTPVEGMRETLREGYFPNLRGKDVRSERLDVKAIALEIGCIATYDPATDLYRFTPAN